MITDIEIGFQMEINSLKNIAKSIKSDYEAVMAGQSNLNEELLENEFKMIANKLGVDPTDLWQECEV